MKHYVLTRLGLTVTDEDWYKNKLPIFEKICFASVANQIDQNFVWIIALDDRAPSFFKEQLTHLLKGHDNYLVVPIDLQQIKPMSMLGYAWVWDAVVEHRALQPFLPDAEEFIITSMLDDDDAWHKETTARAAAHFGGVLECLVASEPSRSYLIACSSGAVLTFANGQWFYLDGQRIEDREWPFHSMSVFVLARFMSGITAYTSRHRSWADFHKVVGFDLTIETTDFPMWLYTQHAAAMSPEPNKPAVLRKISQQQCDAFGLKLADLQAIDEAPQPQYKHLRDSKTRLRDICVAASTRYLERLKNQREAL